MRWASLGLVHRAATDDSTENACLSELCGRNFGKVVGKNDEVGVLARFQFTLLPFLKLGIGRARRISTDAIFERDFFLRFPSVFRPAIGTFTCYTSVESAKRTDGFQ